MSMLGRRGLLKAFGLLPVAAAGKNKKEPGVPWSNQQFQLLIVNAATGGFSGVFVYSPGPGANNLIYSVTKGTLTDPFGNVPPGPGAFSYEQFAGTYYAVQHAGGGFSWYSAASEAGPWTNDISLGRDFSLPSPGLALSGALFAEGTILLQEQAATPPTPTGSGTLYVDGSGHLHYLGPGGTNTVLAGP